MAEMITAKGSPTKSFFINMLTRDIDINDAILDLLDNCLDGVVRQKAAEGIDRSSKDFYKGYQANINITSDSFEIEDNCGGIPLDKAKNYAFRMGREDPSQSEEAATVGIYGIGMKRAIFKIGKSAIVHSVTSEDDFTVIIPKDWNSRPEWDFNIIINNRSDTVGTKVTINDINESIKILWKEEGHRSVFINNLIAHIRDSYSLIIERGFSVAVNGISVKPNEISLVFSDDIKPFIYTNTIDNVDVRLAVGFYAAPPSIDETDRMAEATGQRSAKDAGWTVICNDRVVLYNNKDYLTGWGEYQVPKYHPQFIGIRGIVEFESKQPDKLPMTTTKRGIDLASPVYAEVKRKMCEGLKLFTNFTNNWKGTANAEKRYFDSAEHLKLDELVHRDQDQDNMRVSLATTRDGGKQFKPKLPRKENSSDIVHIRFSVNQNECQRVGHYIFEDDLEHTPSAIGEECYKRFLKKAVDDN